MDEISKFWRVYQRALLTKTAPHIPPPYNKQTLVKYLQKNNLLFARWITDFDCAHETEWYHVIKDSPFDISSLKAKRRYEVNKGIKNFYTQTIDPNAYSEELYEIVTDAYTSYPEKYRPKVNKADFMKDLKAWRSPGIVLIGAFDRADDKLCGFAYLICNEDYVSYSMHRVIPAKEKTGINAALVFGVINFFERNSHYRYLDDGERAIRHETKFQDYLMKYFGFRRAYCRLNVLYNPYVKLLVNILYPFRNAIYKFRDNNFFYNIYCVLEQERIRRSFL